MRVIGEIYRRRDRQQAHHVGDLAAPAGSRQGPSLSSASSRAPSTLPPSSTSPTELSPNPSPNPLTSAQKRATIFNTSYNPLNTRTGAKVLRQRLKGPAVAAYYPPRPTSFKILQGMYPGYEAVDEPEAERLDHIAIVKQRGKGYVLFLFLWRPEFG